MRKRGTNLLDGIEEMLNDPDGKALGDKIYNPTILGSPVWFDLLKNLITIRGAIKPKEEKQTS